MLEQYQHSERALICALAECYIQGVSTRKVGRFCEELFGGRVSVETVSRYALQLDDELEPWRGDAIRAIRVEHPEGIPPAHRIVRGSVGTRSRFLVTTVMACCCGLAGHYTR